MNALKDVQAYLKYLKQMGISGFECSPKALNLLNSWGKPLEKVEVDTLAAIHSDLSGCRRCKLSGGSHRIVFGRGNPRAKLVFVGVGPEMNEDNVDKPVAGEAGKLLARIIQAIHLTEDEVYICNVIKCIIPRDTILQSGEIDACLPFLNRQLAVIKPDFICTLGLVASRAFIGATADLSGLRGRFYPYGGMQVLPTYHPSELLVAPEKKRDVWQDMQMLMKAMGKDQKNSS
jgi:uracil-DNA glycosylase